ncbi:hypothetical protein ACNTMW_04970 [Planosporangium sp. 12N6]|uniref:hypothetical protein n=1 Tax=Planosporangium spinosum TaxID=3402278 RepID=UPI003CE8C7EF
MLAFPARPEGRSIHGRNLLTPVADFVTAVVRSVWSRGVCPSLLASPTSTAPVDAARRQAFRDRVDAYNNALARACDRYGPHCRWDGGAVYRAAFDLDRLSVLDFFHPSSAGQDEIARLTWPETFTW